MLGGSGVIPVLFYKYSKKSKLNALLYKVILVSRALLLDALKSVSFSAKTIKIATLFATYLK
jgi:hypothetical protein